MLGIYTLIFLIIDIVSKIIVKSHLSVLESKTLIKNFLRITYVRNTGAAWSIFSNNTLFVIIVSLIIIVFLGYYLYTKKPKDMLSKMGYALILGGAIGNFLDRILYGYVIDFIDIKIFNYDYPIFNLADAFIVIGAIMLVIKTRRGQDGNKGTRKCRNKNR